MCTRSARCGNGHRGTAAGEHAASENPTSAEMGGSKKNRGFPGLNWWADTAGGGEGGTNDHVCRHSGSMPTASGEMCVSTACSSDTRPGLRDAGDRTAHAPSLRRYLPNDHGVGCMSIPCRAGDHERGRHGRGPAWGGRQGKGIYRAGVVGGWMSEIRAR